MSMNTAFRRSSNLVSWRKDGRAANLSRALEF